MSPPLGVQSDHQVVPVIPLVTVRTEPSARQTFIMLPWSDCASSGLQAALFQGGGWGGNGGRGPARRGGKVGCRWSSQSQRVHILPPCGGLHWPIFSANRSVFEVPSGMVLTRDAPCQLAMFGSATPL